MTRLMNYRSKRRVKGIGLHLRPWSRGIVVRVAYSRLGELNSSEDIAQQTFVREHPSFRRVIVHAS